MESDEHATQMLEVPGHFQKPHQIFILEKADWSFENTAQEENDPLCLEEHGCEGTAARGEPPARARLTVKQEPAATTRPPREWTVKQEEVHHSTSIASDSKCNTPVSETALDSRAVKTESSQPSPHYDTHTADAGPGSTQVGIDSTAAIPVGSVDVDVRLIEDDEVFCRSHPRKRMSYAQMLTIAFMDSPNRRKSLREIYKYAERNFPSVFFRGSWRASIRHVLSVNPLFVKAQRTKKGKGHYWTLERSLADRLEQQRSRPFQICCKWELVSRLHNRRHCSPPPPPPQPCRGAACLGKGSQQKLPRVYGSHADFALKQNRPRSVYPFPDRPIDAHDVVDIKEEPFPEELPTEKKYVEQKCRQKQKMKRI